MMVIAYFKNKINSFCDRFRNQIITSSEVKQKPKLSRSEINENLIAKYTIDIEELEKFISTKQSNLAKIQANDRSVIGKSLDGEKCYPSKIDYQSNIFYEKKYLNHSSKAKYVFRVPTEGYLRHLKCQDVANYDWIQNILSTNPMVQPTINNYSIELVEKIMNEEYHCGQFDNDCLFHGYGFYISSSGYVEQGTFIHGELQTDMPNLFIFDSDNRDYIFMSRKGEKGCYAKIVNTGFAIEKYERQDMQTYEVIEKDKKAPHKYYRSLAGWDY